MRVILLEFGQPYVAVLEVLPDSPCDVLLFEASQVFGSLLGFFLKILRFEDTLERDGVSGRKSARS